MMMRRMIIVIMLCISITAFGFSIRSINNRVSKTILQHGRHSSITSKISPVTTSSSSITSSSSSSSSFRLSMFPDPEIWPQSIEGASINIVLGLLLLVSKQKSLTRAGVLHAGILGLGLYTFLDFQGWFLCVTYLILGSLVTKIKMKEKKELGIAEKRDGARGPENVWGSAATAMILAILTYLIPAAIVPIQVGFVASLATKLSDTFGSEVGKAYGKTTYLVTTLKPVPRGTEGAVSLEGTVAGIVGSILIVMLGIFTNLITGWKASNAIIVSAFIANFVESYIGATYQDKVKWLSNELVNFINTTIGAILAIILFSIF